MPGYPGKQGRKPPLVEGETNDLAIPVVVPAAVPIPRRKRTQHLTPEVQQRLCDALRAGNTRRAAAAYAGISHKSFYEWLRLRPAFTEAVSAAEAAASVRNVALIQQAAQSGQWQAAAWWLERRFPDEWGRQDRIRQEHSGPGGGPIPLTVHDLIRAAAEGSEGEEA